MPALDRAALKAQLLREYAELLEERLPEGPLTLEEIEAVVEELGRVQDTRLEELLIQEQTPPPDNQATCPQCQAPAPFKRRLPLDVLTMHGSRRLQRRYHRCTRCGHGFAPLDLRLRLDGRNATRQVRAWQAKYGSLDAFATVPALLRDLRGLVISASTVERTTLEVGAALVAAEAAPGVVPAAADTTARPRRRGLAVDRLYLEMDGVYCPLREEWKKDGSLGKLRCRYGECKVGMVFQPERNTEGLDEGVRWRAYTATLAKIEAFTPRLVALAKAHGSDRARELVVLGDGAEWIWHLCEQHFPRAVQIVDYWHMTQHLYPVANARFGAGTPEAATWVKDSQWYLDRDMPATALARIQEWQPKSATDREVRDREYGYFEKNQERLRYETFLKHGYQIGSGLVEAGCRQLVTQRLDESGMHWRESSAEAVLAIRAKLKSTTSTDLRAYC